MKLNLSYEWTRLRRILFVKSAKMFSSNGHQDRMRKPKRMSESEQTACEIYLQLLHNKESKLHYDIKTQECYISSGDKTLFVFLEAGNVKIINSVFGYDVHISHDLEQFLLDKFIREMAIRRMTFKREVLSKINHSLDLTLEKVKNGNFRKIETK
jgi:hypothetical protein